MRRVHACSLSAPGVQVSIDGSGELLLVHATKGLRSVICAKSLDVHIPLAIALGTETSMLPPSRQLLRTALRLSIHLCAYSGQRQGMLVDIHTASHSHCRQGGHFSISSTVAFSTKQNYLPNSNVSRLHAGYLRRCSQNGADPTN